MKKYIGLVLALVLAFSMLVACAPEEAAPPAEKPTPPAEKPTPPAEKPKPPPEKPKPIALRYQFTWADVKGEPLTEETHWIKSELEKRTDGGLTLDIGWGQAFCKQTEAPDATRTGAVDTGIIMLYIPKANPFQAAPYASSLMFAGLETGESAAVYMKLAEKFPEAQKEVEERMNQKWLCAYDLPAYGLISSKEVKGLEDIKGLKVRVAGKPITECYKAVGAVPISMSSSEVYDGLSKGVLDATVCSSSVIYKWKWYETCKYFIPRTLVGSIPFYAWTINMDVFNKLPSDYQKVLVDVGKEVGERHPSVLIEAEAVLLEKMINEEGLKVVELTPEAIADWQAMVDAKPLYEEYVKTVEDMGYANAREVLEGYCDLLNYHP